MVTTTTLPSPLHDRRISLPFVPQSTAVTVSFEPDSSNVGKEGRCIVIFFVFPFFGCMYDFSLPASDLFLFPSLPTLVGYDIGVSTEASALIQDDMGLSREFNAHA